ncbi:unnamed protein product [Bemisia tabaci]|uniref:CCHC-type domain-containing protein n=1 Tax=Bemisia tabaci TaxID=7038 RepID=A0A9P0F0D6_BEMTA|nr:unnamed protein product [Bemisia tabaci]
MASPLLKYSELDFQSYIDRQKSSSALHPVTEINPCSSQDSLASGHQSSASVNSTQQFSQMDKPTTNQSSQQPSPDTSSTPVNHPSSPPDRIPHIHPLQLSSILRRSEVQGVEHVTKVNRSTSQVSFKTRYDANCFLANHKLDRSKYTVFIPKYKVLKKGVLKDIPTEYTEDEISDMIETDFEVYEIKRMYRYNKSEHRKVPLPLVTITFLSNTLPETVKLDYYIAHVDLYINRVTQCYNFFHYGHLQRFCKGKKRCEQCGKPAHESDECPEKSPKCINCQGSHLPTDINSPTRKQSLKVNGIMAESNVSYKEALSMRDSYSDNYKFGIRRSAASVTRNLPKTVTRNRFTILQEECFPPLKPSNPDASPAANRKKTNNSSISTKAMRKKKRNNEEFPTEWANRLKLKDATTSATPKKQSDEEEANLQQISVNETHNSAEGLLFVGSQVDASLNMMDTDSSPPSPPLGSPTPQQLSNSDKHCEDTFKDNDFNVLVNDQHKSDQ